MVSQVFQIIAVLLKFADLGKSFTETLLEKWSSASNPSNVMQPYIDGVEVKCSSPSSVMVSSKSSNYSWTFILQSGRPLKAVALLQDAHRIHFHISSVSKGNVEVKVRNNQEWISHLPVHNVVEEYKVMVVFKTGIYGTFRQSVVFDFGTEPYLVPEAGLLLRDFFNVFVGLGEAFVRRFSP